MNDSDFTPQEQELINRLANAPQSDLSPDAFDAIRTRLLDGMDSPPIQAKPRRPLSISTPLVAAIAAVLAVAIGVSVLLNQPQILVPTPSFMTSIPSTNQPATVTMPLETTAPITTPIPLHITTPQVTPEITLTPTLEPVIVIEGPVQSITANVITIYGIDITLSPDDPLLSVLVVGDMVRIEADYDPTTTVIVAVTVEPVSNEINVNPATNESWRDDGSCNNPPPAWAPANGWRRRCENSNSNSGSGNNGNGSSNGNNGNGNGKGNNDDDDD